MSAESVLATLRAHGVKLFAQGEKLTYRCPPGVMTDDLRHQIQEHKTALLAIQLPRPPRHAGGFPVTLTTHPCQVCGGVEWQQHVTYRYCLTCGREAGNVATVQDGYSSQSNDRGTRKRME